MRLLISIALVSTSLAFTVRPSLILRSNTKISLIQSTNSILDINTYMPSDKNDDKKKEKEPEKYGVARFLDALEKAEKDPKSKKPPIYEPGPYPYRILCALTYLVPIADAFDLGKYMFEAYPETLAAYNTVFGVVAGVYNGVPFLPFAVFFLLSYISRAPTFPTDVRFHAAQAFMLSIIQFIPSVLFGFAEKAGVPGMAVPYNTGRNFLKLFQLTDSLFNFARK